MGGKTGCNQIEFCEPPDEPSYKPSYQPSCEKKVSSEASHEAPDEPLSSHECAAEGTPKNSRARNLYEYVGLSLLALQVKTFMKSCQEFFLFIYVLGLLVRTNICFDKVELVLHCNMCNSIVSLNWQLRYFLIFSRQKCLLTST